MKTWRGVTSSGPTTQCSLKQCILVTSSGHIARTDNQQCAMYKFKWLKLRMLFTHAWCGHVTSCTGVEITTFRRSCCFRHWEIEEVAHAPETYLLFYQISRRHILRNCDLHSSFRENLKSQAMTVWTTSTSKQ
jgi:hypothetical protein